MSILCLFRYDFYSISCFYLRVSSVFQEPNLCSVFLLKPIFITVVMNLYTYIKIVLQQLIGKS